MFPFLIFLSQMTTTSKALTHSRISISLVFSLFLVTYTLSCHSSSSCREVQSSTLWTTLLVLAGLSLASICLIVLARTTMVAWITVLVLLAFSGKRRRVLVHEGRKITADVAMDLIKVMVKERGFVTVICATAVSCMAMAQVTRF